jgi:type II secretory pathway pseudopilin PulG
MENFMDSKKAFSLAEALMTLLILCIVVALSVPFLSKSKKYQKKNNHDNQWSCTLNAAGKHVTTTKIHDPVTNVDNTKTSTSGDYCEFDPPQNVNKFYVTAIGGGGGGASGSTDSNMTKTKDGYAYFVPPISGKYYVIVIGAGGGGGARNCGRGTEAAAGGGGSGAAIAGSIELKADTTYTLYAGQGGKAGTNGHSGKAGEQSFFKGITPSGQEFVLTAGGGEGGLSKFQGVLACSESSARGTGGLANIGGGRLYAPPGLTVRGGRDCLRRYLNNKEAYGGGCICCRAGGAYSTGCMFYGLENQIGDGILENAIPIGKGGDGAMHNARRGFDGGNGFVKVVYSSIFGGEGGKAGMQSYYIYQRSPGKTKVFIGQGGKGATGSNENGKPGMASRFGDRVIAAGGEGGRKEFTNASLDDANPQAPGGDGGASPAPRDLAGFTFADAFGGFSGTNAAAAGLNGSSPGSGGGGGGANASGSGKGGDGLTGIVLVEW